MARPGRIAANAVAATQLTAVLMVVLMSAQAGPAAADPARAPAPAPARQQQLLRLLQQDCGSCHGLRMKGGLGPPLLASAMRALPRDSIAAVIYHGRPGTAMPPWNSLLSAAEAEWLADLLQSAQPLVALEDSK